MYVLNKFANPGVLVPQKGETWSTKLQGFKRYYKTSINLTF